MDVKRFLAYFTSAEESRYCFICPCFPIRVCSIIVSVSNKFPSSRNGQHTNRASSPVDTTLYRSVLRSSTRRLHTTREPGQASTTHPTSDRIPIVLNADPYRSCPRYPAQMNGQQYIHLLLHFSCSVIPEMHSSQLTFCIGSTRHYLLPQLSLSWGIWPKSMILEKSICLG